MLLSSSGPLVKVGREARAVRSRASLVPPQHGAWAFIGLPLILGALVAQASWSTPLLVWAAFTSYPASYFALSLARARRGGRFRRPLLFWAFAAAIPAGMLLLTNPWLVWVVLGYAALFAVNVAFARRNKERDLVNDAVLIVQVVALVPLTWLLADPAGFIPERVWLLTLVCALVLVGSTMHVKSLLRERRRPAYAFASRIVSVGSLIVVIGLGWMWGWPNGISLVVPFVFLTARSLKTDWDGWRPARIGLLELAGFIGVAVGAGIAVSL